MSGRPIPSSTTQSVYERLRAEVLSGQHRPEQRLKISEIGANLNVSIGAVREALSRLTSEGLVTAEPQRGFRVAPVSVADLRDLCAVRIDLEISCLRRSIANGDVAWEAAVLASHHRLAGTPMMSETGGFDQGWSAAHTEFHRILASACGSPWLMKLRQMLFVHNERYLDLALAADKGDRDIGPEHRELMEAALARDAERAAQLMTEHITRTAASIEHGLARPPANDRA